MTTVRGAWVSLSFLINRRARKRRELRKLREWYRRRQLLQADMGREPASERGVMTILVLINIGMWCWYFYFVYKWAPYVWPSG